MAMDNDPQTSKPTGEASIQPGDSESAEENMYDPYDYGNDDNPISATGAVIHIVRMTIGVGILALPLVHKRVGYFIGICESLVVGFLYYHIIHILVATEYKLCRLTKTSKLTFMNIVNTTFKVVSPKKQILGPFVKFIMHVYYGIPYGNALNLIIISTNIKSILEYHNVEVEITRIMTAVIVPIILLCWIRRLKFMVPLSTLTNIFTCVIICIIFGSSMITRNSEVVAKPIGDVKFIPQSFAILIAAYRCTGLYIPLKNEMKTPRQFSSYCGVINIAGTVLIALYTIFGATIYWNYGNDVRDNILLNLPKHEWLSVVVCGMYTAALFVSYYLSFHVRVDMYWTSFFEPMTANCRYQILIEYLFRTALNISIYILAIFIPNFGLFASISGTLGILAEIGVPPLLDTLLISKFDNRSGLFLKLVKNVCIITICLVLFGSSVVGCLREIIKVYTK